MRYQEGTTVFGAAADALAAEDGRSGLSVDGLQVWAKALAWQGSFHVWLGHTERARDLLGQGMVRLQDPRLAGQDVREARALVLYMAGYVELHWGDRQAARERMEQSLALYRALDCRYEVANALDGLGEAAQTSDVPDLSGSGRFHREALVLRRALGDRAGVAFSLRMLALILGMCGQHEEAESLAREAVAIAQEMGDRVSLGHYLASLGVALWQGGKHVESWAVLERCLAITDEPRNRFHRVIANVEASSALIHLGRYQEARAYAHTALALGRELDHQWGIGAALLALGDVAMAQGAYVEARQYLQEGADVLDRAHHGQACEALIGMALLERAEGRRRQAVQSLCRACRLLEGVEAHLFQIAALAVAALLAADAGDAEHAIERYALAARHPIVANSRWFEDVAGREIAALAATLPPDVVAAARARGQAGDLDEALRDVLRELEGEVV
jgi:tetratricopeptide (TPR) repeat protein